MVGLAVRRTKAQQEREEKEAMKYWDRCVPCKATGIIVTGALKQICARCEGIGFVRKRNCWRQGGGHEQRADRFVSRTGGRRSSTGGVPAGIQSCICPPEPCRTRERMKRRYWKTTELRQLRAVYPHRENGELGAMFGRTWSAVQNMAGKLGLKKSPAFRAGPACRWQKGNRPWNDGKRGWQPGGRARLTQFRKGHRGARQRPVGSERVERDGTVMVKVAEPRRWQPKARVIWEQHYGPIPPVHIVRLKDGNKRNFAPSNLVLMTRGENARMNHRPRRPKAANQPAWLVALRMAA